NYLLKIVLPLIVFWGVHILCYYLLFNTWQAHYKLDIAEGFSLSNIFWKIERYTSSILLLDFVWPTNIRQWWYALLKNQQTIWFTKLFVSFLFVWGWFKYGKLNTKKQISYTLFVCFLFSLSLIIYQFISIFFFEFIRKNFLKFIPY